MALRDWPLCDAKLVLWSQRPLRAVMRCVTGQCGQLPLRDGAGGDGAGLGPVPWVVITDYSARAR